MENIIIIEENIDVKPFLDEMDLDDWDWVSKQRVAIEISYGFTVSLGKSRKR